jgi:hypothetical protein
MEAVQFSSLVWDGHGGKGNGTTGPWVPVLHTLVTNVWLQNGQARPEPLPNPALAVCRSWLIWRLEHGLGILVSTSKTIQSTQIWSQRC